MDDKTTEEETRELTLDDACILLNACRTYIDTLREYYPEVHEDVMRAFEGAGQNDPELEAARQMFIDAMHA